MTPKALCNNFISLNNININDENINLLSIRDLQYNPLLNKSSHHSHHNSFLREELISPIRVKKSSTKFSECYPYFTVIQTLMKTDYNSASFPSCSMGAITISKKIENHIFRTDDEDDPLMTL